MEVGISEVAAEGVEESESKQMECPDDRSPGDGAGSTHPASPCGGLLLSLCFPSFWSRAILAALEAAGKSCAEWYSCPHWS